MRVIYHWPSVQAYFDAGNGFVACHRRFGIAHATWIKAIRNGNLHVPLRGAGLADRRRLFDWSEVQAYYDEGHSMNKCLARFGFSRGAWHSARIRGELKTRPKVRFAIERLALKRANRRIIKQRLLDNGSLQNRCYLCGIADWQGLPLTLQIDHINGDRLDYRLENLRILCPNCHSQTDTFAGRNRLRQR
jgi:5-methylcytosine-specific restriction endonuclease McrA